MTVGYGCTEALGEWEIHEIDMAVPLSPDEVLLKRTLYCTINRKKDRVMFQGNDSREFG
jgi:glucosamine-6-phosphate deaminase